MKVFINLCVDISTFKRIVFFLLWICLSVLIFQMVAALSFAAEQAPSDQNLNAADPGSEPTDASPDPSLPKVDRTHEVLSNSIMATARWMDSFFYDERFAQEENKTRVKIKASSFYELDEGVDFKLRAQVRLVLPGFEDRLALALSGDDEDEGVGLDAADNIDIESLKRTDKEDTSISLRYIVETIERRNISTTLGFRWRDDRIVVVPSLRWRETFAFSSWELRFVQKLKWFSDVGWEEKTSFDLDRLLYETYLFRTTIDGTWSEEDEMDKGYTYNLKFSLYQPLGALYALTYEIGNNFQTKPYNRLENITLRLRYRQRLWRDWLFLEIAPQLAFPRDKDFDTIPGILVFLEAILGHYDKE